MSTVTQTKKLDPTMAGGTSLDIVVGQGEVVVISLLGPAGPLTKSVQAPIKRRINGFLRHVPGPTGRVYLTDEVPEFAMGAPGTYVVVLPPTAELVAVYEDR